MRYIEINKNLIPYGFEIELDDEIFTMEVYYNARFDYFTIDLYHNDQPLLFGEKLTLGTNLFKIVGYKGLLVSVITPKDLANLNERITFDNLNEQVFLYVGDIDENV